MEGYLPSASVPLGPMFRLGGKSDFAPGEPITESGRGVILYKGLVAQGR